MGHALRKYDDEFDDIPTPKPKRRLEPGSKKRGPVEEFLAEIMEYAAGNEMQIRHVHRCYRVMCREHKHWPDLSIKKFSQELLRLGCKRRKDYQGSTATIERPTVYEFPMEMPT